MILEPINQHAAWNGVNRYGVRFSALDPHRQATVLIDVYGLVNLRRNKVNSFSTKKARAYLLHLVIEQLRESGFFLKNLMNLREAHLESVLTRWRQEALSASAITTRLSHLRWLFACLGKPGMVKPADFYGFQKNELTRITATTVDKSWSTRGTIPQQKIDQVKAYDPWVGIQLELMHAFGLRITEAILIKPRASHMSDSVRIEEGTKGGRTRVVQIRNPQQLEVLERAKEMSLTTRKGAMVPHGKTPTQARRRIYYVCEKFGITKAELDITPHGLRHEYANDLYERVSGTPSAVRGGSQILNAAKEAAALHAVTQDLGHARLSITPAYTGPRKRVTRGANIVGVTPLHSWTPPDPNAQDPDAHVF